MSCVNELSPRGSLVRLVPGIHGKLVQISYGGVGNVTVVYGALIEIINLVRVGQVIGG